MKTDRNRETAGAAEQGGRRLECALLVAVLLVQLAILWCLFRRSPAVPAFAAGGDAGQDPALAMPAAGQPLLQRRSAAPPGRAATVARLFPEPRTVNERMHSVFEHALRDFERLSGFMEFINEGWETVSASPVLDMRERGNAYVIIFSVPGFDSDSVELALNGRLLTISATRRSGAQPAIGGRFERRVLLPGPVSADACALTDLQNGLLRVILPKAPSADEDFGRVRVF